MTTDTKTPAQRVRESEARKIKAGGKRLSPMMISPEAAKALSALLRVKFAGSITACVERAIIDANNNRKGRGQQ